MFAEGLSFVQRLNALITHGCSRFHNNFKPKGVFRIEHFRKGKLIGIHHVPNGITNVGKDYVLNVAFDGVTTQLTAWHIGLIGSGSWNPTGPLATDTMASHPNWAEMTLYDEAIRQPWGAGTTTSQSITNAAAATFTINGVGDSSLKGIFIVSNNTKGGTTGTLWSTALFATPIAVIDNDQLKITYTVVASGA